MTEADFAAELATAGGRSFAPELERWVHGRDELPLEELLLLHGVAVLQEPSQLAHRLGMRVSESQGVQIKTVLRGGLAEAAGFSAGDEWLGIEAIETTILPTRRRVKGAQQQAGWRMSRLDDLLVYAGPATQVTALVSRDKRLLRLTLTMPQAITTWRLAVKDAALVNKWLEPAR